MKVYDYNYIMSFNNNYKKPSNIKKWITAILSIIFILLIIMLGFIIYKDRKEFEFAKNIEKESIEIKEKQRVVIEEQEKRLKNSQELSDEQINKIENIYSLEEKSAFLTFDDGPTSAVTPFILDYLKQENIKATFFVLGNRVKANPDLIKREFEEGHYIANHGYTHKYSQIYANVQNVLEEYNYTETAIQEALENPDYHSRVFRFPGGSNGGYYAKIKSEAKEFLKENHIAYLDWNALTNDAAGAHSKEALMESAINTIGEKNSVVILMHDASDKILTYETLPELVQYLREKGYIFKNLYDIL